MPINNFEHNQVHNSRMIEVILDWTRRIVKTNGQSSKNSSFSYLLLRFKFVSCCKPGQSSVYKRRKSEGPAWEATQQCPLISCRREWEWKMPTEDHSYNHKAKQESPEIGICQVDLSCWDLLDLVSQHIEISYIKEDTNLAAYPPALISFVTWLPAQTIAITLMNLQVPYMMTPHINPHQMTKKIHTFQPRQGSPFFLVPVQSKTCRTV